MFLYTQNTKSSFEIMPIFITNLSLFSELFTDLPGILLCTSLFFNQEEVARHLIWKALSQDENQNIAHYIFNDENFINQIGNIVTQEHLAKTVLSTGNVVEI